MVVSRRCGCCIGGMGFGVKEFNSEVKESYWKYRIRFSNVGVECVFKRSESSILKRFLCIVFILVLFVVVNVWK